MAKKRMVLTVCAVIGGILGCLLAVAAVFYIAFVMPIAQVFQKWTANAVKVTYTEEVLIDQEAPESLVWYARLQGPSSGVGLILVPEYQKYAAIGADSIMEVDGEWQAAVEALKVPETVGLPVDPEIPPEDESVENDIPLRMAVKAVLQADPVLSGAVRDPMTLFPERTVRMEDRIYALCVEINRCFTESIEDYTGSEILYVVLDEDGSEILFAKRYFLPDYWGGARQTLVRTESGQPAEILE